MDSHNITNYLSDQGFAVKQVSLLNTLGKLGQEGFSTFDLTSNFTEQHFGSRFSTCIYCAKVFSSPMALHGHVRNEHCTPNVDAQKQYRQTIKSEDTSYLIVKNDSESFDSKRARTRRLETKPRKPYGKRGNTTDLEIQLKGPFVCNLCNEVFEECCVFSIHMNNMHFKRRRLIHRCQICEKRFTNKYGDNIEVPLSALSPELNCDVCNEPFALQAHLDSHRKKYHSKIKPFGCSLCSKSFSQSAGLSQHMKTHSGIRPYACSICPKAFRQKAGLDQHMRIHSNTKPYCCLLCGRAFTQSAHLSQHMRIHTKIEPYECDLCERRFKQSSHLNFHMRSHNPEGCVKPKKEYVNMTPMNNKEYQFMSEFNTSISQ